MASTGQESMQAPQSVQVSASITNWSSPWLMASTGQVDSQAPQEMHSPEITWAMVLLLILGYGFFRKSMQYTSKNLDYINIYGAYTCLYVDSILKKKVSDNEY